MILPLTALYLYYLIKSSFGQCGIDNATIHINQTESWGLGPGNRRIVIEGLYNGTRATSVTWRWNGTEVDRNTDIEDVVLYDGGGETRQSDGPCHTHVYRVALLVQGYLPGNYTYTIDNSDTPSPVTSPTLTVEDPGPPTNLVLKQISNRRVQATWFPPSGYPRATYRIFENTLILWVHGSPIAGTIFTSESLPAHIVDYIVRVRATTGTYFGPPAESSRLRVLDLLLPNVTVSYISRTSILVEFFQPNESLPVDMYKVTVVGECDEESHRIEFTTSDSVTFHDLEAGMQYVVRVTAFNNATESAVTKMNMIVTNEEAPSDRPRALMADEVRSTNITLTWMEIDCLDRNGVITSYFIRFGERSEPSFTTIYTQSNATTLLITGLQPYTWYTFVVAGVNSINTGPFSDSINIRTSLDLFLSVVSLSAESITMSISGDVNSSSVTHTATLTSSTCADTPIKSGSTTSNLVTIDGLEAGTQYSVTVTGTNLLAELTGIGSTMFKTNESAPSGSPDSVRATGVNSTSIVLSWTEIECLNRNGIITNYVIQYNEGYNLQRMLYTQDNATSHVIVGLTPFTIYNITVAGVNSVSTGPFSSSSLIRTAATKPTGVRNLSYEAKFFSVILSWDIPDPLNGILLYYNIEYTVNETYQETESISFNTFSISNLYPNTSISNVSVFAVNEEGGGPSEYLDYIATVDKPDAVQNFTVIIVTNDSVRVSWNNDIFHDITEFVIYYKQTGLQENYVETSKTLPASASFLIISGLIAGRVYVFEVVARAVFGKLSVSGTRVSSEPVLLIPPAVAPSTDCRISRITISSMAGGIAVGVLLSIILSTITIVLLFNMKRTKSKCYNLEMKDCSAYAKGHGEDRRYECTKDKETTVLDEPIYVNQGTISL